MTDSSKATRAEIQIGSLRVDGFMLPDGSYRISQTQAAEAVETDPRRISDFLRTKAFKRLLSEGQSTSDFSQTYSPDTFTVDFQEGQTRINGLHLEVVILYWHWQSYRGNKQALSLCIALATETLERRFDSAFGVARSEEEYNDLLSQRVQQLERDLQRLGEAYAEEDFIRSERDQFYKRLVELGEDPYALPEDTLQE